MKRLVSILLPGIMILLSNSASGEWPALQTGVWEFDVDYDLIGIPQTFPHYTITECISDEHPYPTISRPGDECQSLPQGQFGQTYTWSMNCSTNWETVQGMGRMHYFRNRAHGDVHLQIFNPQNPPQMMVFRLEGKYTGRQCEAEPESTQK